jgi:hypothetical protein
MRKATLFAAAMFVAAFTTTSNVATAAGADPAMAAQQNSSRFIADAMNPFMASSKPAAAPKKAHKKMAKKKAMKKKGMKK